MNQHKSEATVADTFDEADVAEYLHSHPDFFDRHSDLLMGLKLAHEHGSAAVSLVERQECGRLTDGLFGITSGAATGSP